MAADLQHPARAMPTRRRMAKARVEEPGVMDTKLAHHGKVGGHLGRAVWGHMHGLPADEDIERAGIKDDPPVGCVDLLPVVRDGVVRDLVQVDQARVRLCPVAHQRIWFSLSPGRARTENDLGLISA